MIIELYRNGRTIKNATWIEIQGALETLKERESNIRLTITPRPDNGPILLDIQSEEGNHMPGLLMTGGYTRDYHNSNLAGGEMIDVGGYSYDPAFITRDYERIVSIAKEFFETGDVSPELLKE